MKALARRELWLATAALAVILALPGRAIAVPAAPFERAGADQTYTPVIQDVLSPPRWFRGVDGRVYIEYDLRLINGFPVPATITSIEVRRGRGGKLAELTGDDLATAISPIGSPTANGGR